MSWTLASKPKTYLATLALAKRFAEMDQAPHDRPLSERRLQVYEKIYREGGFRPVTWASAECAETGGIYRVNGKHTSIMLSGLLASEDKDNLPDVFITVEEYLCETLEDVCRLYATFDSKLQSRSARDIYMSFAATLPELRDIPVRTISLAVGGMAYHLNPTTSHQTQPAERAELLLEYPEFVIWLNGILSSLVGSATRGEHSERRSSRHLYRAAVVAAMFGTYRKVVKDATEFWTAVREESGITPSLPDRKLARWLLTTGVDNGAGTKRVKRAPDREFYVKCLHAWNAWRKNEPTDLRYYADSDLPSIK